MSTLYERLAATDDGVRRLAVTRLRREALRALHIALKASGLTQTDLAAKLGIRKSAVSQVLNGDGNLRVKTLAEYLGALGYELDMRLVEAGEPRRAITEQRDVQPAFPPAAAAKTPDATPKVTTEHQVHVINTFPAKILMEVEFQHQPGGMAFTGSAYLVPPASTAVPIAAPGEFKQIRTLTGPVA